jgi:hypothetical protein
MPAKERGHSSVIITCFVDANHARNVVDRKSQTGILIFLHNAPIDWYSKQQMTVESSTFGTDFCALRVATEMIESPRYKLRMFRMSINGAANIYHNNGAVYKNAAIPEPAVLLKKKHHSVAYHRCHEAVAAGTIQVAKQGTTKNLADLFTKGVLTNARRAFVLERFTSQKPGDLIVMNIMVFILISEGFSHVNHLKQLLVSIKKLLAMVNVAN